MTLYSSSASRLAPSDMRPDDSWRDDDHWSRMEREDRERDHTPAEALRGPMPAPMPPDVTWLDWVMRVALVAGLVASCLLALFVWVGVALLLMEAGL